MVGTPMPNDLQEEPEERGLVTRMGQLEIDWPKSIGYFGGIGLAVALDLIEPPLALFIGAIPFLKLLKYPQEPWPVRIAADLIEGAAKPVGGDAESTVRVTTDAASPGRSRTRGRRSQASRSVNQTKHVEQQVTGLE